MIESGIDGKDKKLTKKEKKRTLVEEMLYEDQNTGFSKAKFERIQEVKRKYGERKKIMKKNIHKRYLKRKQK